MSGLAALLSIDTSRLDAKLSVTGGAGSASASLRIDSPLDLLGSAGKAIRSIEALARDPGDLPSAMAEGLGRLARIAPFADIPEIGQAIAILTELKDRLGPLRDLGAIDARTMVNRLMTQSGGIDGLIEQLTGQISGALTGELPAALAFPLDALRDLSKGAPQSAEDVAALFARLLLGLDLDAIREPHRILDGLRARIAGGSDTLALEARIEALRVEIDAVSEALVDRGPDIAAIVLRLKPLRGEIDLLTSTILPQALGALALDLTAIRPTDELARLDKALAVLIARMPVPPLGLADLILEPLRDLGENIDAITADVFTTYLGTVETEIREKFARSDVAKLRDDAETLLVGVVGFLDALPLPALHNRLTQALLALKDHIADLSNFSPVAQLGARMMTLSDALDGIDVSLVKDRIDELAATVKQAVDAFPIEEIRDELASLQQAAADAVAELPPLIAELKAAIDKLAGELTSIDLSGASAQSVSVVHDLRETLKKALSNADIPDAAKAPLGILAGEVRKIDLTVGISGPLDEAVARIDLHSALQPVDDAIGKAREALRKLSPSALVATLDAEFSKAFSALASISPDALIAQLSASFHEAADQIDRIDPTRLIQPLQDAFESAVLAARHACDPAPLLAPVVGLYREIEDILDALDPFELFGPIVAEVSRLPARMAAATSSAIAQGVAGGEALVAGAGGIFRFGDILRPFALLIGEARRVVRRGAGAILEEGLALLEGPLTLLNQGAQMVGGHLAEIGAAVERRRGLVDATFGTGALAELRAALDRLARIEAGLAEHGRSSVALNSAVLSIQFDAHIIVSFPARERLDGAVSAFDNQLASPELGQSFARLGSVASSFFPPALDRSQAGLAIMDRIDALFAVIDPTPIADEMDAIGALLQAKFQSFASNIAKALFKIFNAVFEELDPLLPRAMLGSVGAALDAIRGQLKALDPASLESELGEVLDAVVAAFDAYSPLAFAGTLTGTFDAIKAKLMALDPKVLLGDLDPLADVIARFGSLRPSLVLAPLVAQAEAVDVALAGLLDFSPADILAKAIINLKAEIELVLKDIEVELDGLLGDIEAAGGGGGGSISVSASIG